MVSLDLEAAGSEGPIDSPALAALHPDDHPLPIITLTAVVPRAEDRVDVGLELAGPTLVRAGGGHRSQQGNDGGDAGDRRG